MDLQVGIALLVRINDVVDETLFGIEPPGSLRTEAHVVILSARDELGRALAVPEPVETAAGIDQSVDLEIGGMQQETDHGVIVVQFRVAGNDGARRLEHPVFRGLAAAGGQEDRRGKGNEGKVFHQCLLFL